jgi:tol-pal system protein YbgF
MSIRLSSCAALIISAAFLFSPLVFAQAPIIDASVDNNRAPVHAVGQQVAEPVAQQGMQGELYNQLTLLQQEVMQLRGIVEEQAHILRQVKEQNMERYIDLDRRLGTLMASPAAIAPSVDKRPASVATTVGAQPGVVAATAGEQEAYDSAYQLVLDKRFNDALKAFEQLLVNFPAGKYAPNSYYWVGELYQVITPQNLDASREAFSQLLGQYPDHPKVPDAMYKLGKVYFLKGNLKESREWLDKVIAEYDKGANSSAADKARQFINENF